MERALLRRGWWLFPLAGLLLSAAAARWGWWLVALDPALIRPELRRAFQWPYVLFIPALSMIPALWWFSLRLPRSGQRMAWLLALVIVLGAEAVVRLPPVQRTLWTVAKTRSSGPDDFFLREVANLRLRVLEDQPEDPTRVIFAGTSQLIRGIDYATMQAALPGYKVCPRSVAGMVPLRMLSARDYLSVRSNDVVVLYLSAFDLGGVDGFDAEWRRPTASLSGSLAAWRAMPAGHRATAWRSACDVFVAGISELWRSRDASRAALMKAVGSVPERGRPAAIEPAKQAAAEPAAPAASAEVFRNANLQALAAMLDYFAACGARVVAFEGQVNPATETELSRSDQPQVRALLQAAVAQRGGVFVALPEQTVHFSPDDFADHTHLNERGRANFTAYVSGWLSARLAGGRT